ncbi:ABC transporter ATP-binding protein [Nakamurella flavida]|uniref:ABC transporter ATP-binding protein n=1 Tax=Nakamurella flavida TaxID=363630 RepID=A0A938YHZ6_9ACTN|nr:ATP-binding cassette domain-containing protein [Nakamurella flavida]MBM9478041.1 ABC transporter ATP-binding protein [Nakamurella flavida]MDP9778242.1 ABC-type glutathione transport system ATPase component [Nakamurella flavida]
MSPLLQVTGLVKEYRAPHGLFGSRPVRVVDDVDLTVDRGETLGLVGESGSGKTTVARCVLGMTAPTAGSITFDGTDVLSLGRRARAEFRRRVQPVFQDPYASLDPRWTIGRSIAESLVAHRIGTPADRERRVRELLGQVGLPASSADRRPSQLSGGQRQRVGIAAALASGPDLIVADEPVSALDVSVQAQVLNLFAQLQRDLGVAILFVSHDMGVVEHISDRVTVLFHGTVVETAPAAQLFADPQHEYTRALLAAVPVPDPVGARIRRARRAARADPAALAP